MVIIFNIKAVYQALRRDCAATAENVINRFIRAKILLDDFYNLLGYLLFAALVRQSDRTAFSDFLLIKFQHIRSQKSYLKNQAAQLNFKIYWVSYKKCQSTTQLDWHYLLKIGLIRTDSQIIAYCGI